MAQKNTRLGEKQIQSLDNFFSKLQKYRIKTENSDETCIRMFKNNGETTIFEDEAKAYQPYGLQVIKRLINKGVFYTKETVNPETGRKIKVLCLNKQNEIVQDFTQG